MLATIFDKIKNKHKIPISYYWNNSAISPGTKFMEKLHNKILKWITEYKKNNKLSVVDWFNYFKYLIKGSQQNGSDK